MVLFQSCEKDVQVIPAEVRSILLKGRFLCFQSPVIDEPTGVNGLPNTLTLNLIRIQAIPVGSKHTTSFHIRLFEANKSSLALRTWSS